MNYAFIINKMELEKVPFVRYKLDEEKEKEDSKIFTIRLTAKEMKWFKPLKKFLKQPKNSTAMKQLAQIGSLVVLHDPKIAKIIEVVLNNVRRNERIGISEEEEENTQKPANVTQMQQ